MLDYTFKSHMGGFLAEEMPWSTNCVSYQAVWIGGILLQSPARLLISTWLALFFMVCAR